MIGFSDTFSAGRQFRLTGEDAPVWLPIAFAGLGLMLALVASSEIVSAISPDDAEYQPPAQMAAAPPTVAPPVVKPVVKPVVVNIEPVAPPPAPTSKIEEPPPAPPRTEALKVAAPSPQTHFEAPKVVAPTVPAHFEAPKAPAPTVPNCLPVVSIPFERNSARLQTAGLDAATAPLREFLATHPRAILSAEGQADSTGSEQSNILLSYKRAQAATNWLAGSGVPAPQITTRAAGAVPPRDVSQTANNRRVILQIEGVEACHDSASPGKS